MSAPILITGASGLLGWHLARLASKTHPVIAAGGQHKPALPDTPLAQLDLCDLDATLTQLREWQPSAIIHCAAVSKPNDCEVNPEQSQAVNVDASVALARYAAEHAIPFVFTSSDLVFDGQSGLYTETSVPQPVNRYGQQKADAEHAILGVYPQACICRCPLMYGQPSPHASSFLGFMFEALDSGTPCQLFSDEFRSVADVEDVAQALLMAVEQRWTGLIHLGGPERLSRYDIGLILARHSNVDPSIFSPLTQAELTLVAPRPPDVSLNSEKAFSLGYAPRSAELGLQRVVQRRTDSVDA